MCDAASIHYVVCFLKKINQRFALSDRACSISNIMLFYRAEIS